MLARPAHAVGCRGDRTTTRAASDPVAVCHTPRPGGPLAHGRASAGLGSRAGLAGGQFVAAGVRGGVVSRRRTQQPLGPGRMGARRMGVTVRAFFERFDANAVKVRPATSAANAFCNAVRSFPRTRGDGCLEADGTDARWLVVARWCRWSRRGWMRPSGSGATRYVVCEKHLVASRSLALASLTSGDVAPSCRSPSAARAPPHSRRTSQPRLTQTGVHSSGAGPLLCGALPFAHGI